MELEGNQGVGIVPYRNTRTRHWRKRGRASERNQGTWQFGQIMGLLGEYLDDLMRLAVVFVVFLLVGSAMFGPTEEPKQKTGYSYKVTDEGLEFNGNRSN